MKFQLLILILFSITVVNAEIVINEVMYDPEGNGNCNSNDEWVELYNDGAESVNLSSFSLKDDTASTDELNECDFSPGNLTIGPYEYALITDQDTNLYDFINFNGTKACVSNNGVGSGLNNDGDVITLFNDTYNISVDYSTISLVDKGFSLELNENGGWEESLYLGGSPGYENKKKINSSYLNMLKITEFLPNPKGSDNAPIPDGEWVEIYNSGENNIDLLGFILRDNSDSKGVIMGTTNFNDSSTIIKPNQYKVIYKNGGGGFSLNNNGFEKATLYDCYLRRLDEISYSTTKEDVSWSRFNDGWKLTISSAGNENIEDSIDKSYIKIEKIEDLGSDNIAKFGQVIKARLTIYKGDTTKNSISMYVESKTGKRASKVNRVNVYNKFTEYDLAVPIQIDPNCNEKLNETEYYVIINGLDSSYYEDLKIKELTTSLCSNRRVSTSSPLHYEFNNLSQISINDKIMPVKIKIMNDDSKVHRVGVWSYIYRGPKSYSGDREANKKIINLLPESSVELELENEILNETEPGDYKLKVKIIEDSKKTPKEFTSDIKIVTSDNNEKEKEASVSIDLKNQENLITGNVIYESSDVLTSKYGIYFFSGTLVLLIGYLLLKKTL